MKHFTSDWHLGTDRLALMGRPFKTPQEHADKLVENHNSLVAQHDLVYVVGDVLDQTSDPEIWLPEIDRFNGRKILIRGNHDRPFSDEQFKPYFEEIIPDGGGIELTVDSGVREFSLNSRHIPTLDCFMTHYPTQGRTDRFNIVGHIHGVWKVQLNMLNVGVDVHHFYPVSEAQVVFYYQAICTFFDQDAWVGYDPINTQHTDRGKKSKYFNAAS